MQALLKALSSESIERGAQLFFQCKGGTLVISKGSYNAAASSTLREKGICSALFDVYYGKTPVSPAAKEGAAVGFATRRFYQ